MSNKPKNRNRTNSRTIITTNATFSGPIPPPALLQQYNDILPGAADRILTMAENQSKHRHKIEKKVINTDVWTAWVGLLFAFIIAAGGLGGGMFLMYYDKFYEGTGVFVLSLASLIGTFVYNKKHRQN